MDVIEAIKNRRSIRQFINKDISDEILRSIISAAIYAPSAKNRQPWRFCILKDSSKKGFIKLVMENDKDQPDKRTNLLASEHSTWRTSIAAMTSAPILILAFNTFPSERALGFHNGLFDLSNNQSIGAAIQNVLLMAESYNIGSLWINDVYSSYDEINSTYFEIGQFVACIALGYTIEAPVMPRRKLLKQLIDIRE